ncbi:hypothetical protein AAL_02484 [Moelleriella libera RCEF 2490]|uniref:Uncharacterized protein n=1 Tax=Moelleriella libera RCEF 2490 TaxID=1081109 RepID=A0A168ELS3_9HYPO|nr:hypothetical protein AAL_02484 [Moelleriella libera RCEF 2490]
MFAIPSCQWQYLPAPPLNSDAAHPSLSSRPSVGQYNHPYGPIDAGYSCSTAVTLLEPASDPEFSISCASIATGGPDTPASLEESHSHSEIPGCPDIYGSDPIDMSESEGFIEGGISVKSEPMDDVNDVSVTKRAPHLGFSVDESTTKCSGQVSAVSEPHHMASTSAEGHNILDTSGIFHYEFEPCSLAGENPAPLVCLEEGFLFPPLDPFPCIGQPTTGNEVNPVTSDESLSYLFPDCCSCNDCSMCADSRFPIGGYAESYNGIDDFSLAGRPLYNESDALARSAVSAPPDHTGISPALVQSTDYFDATSRVSSGSVENPQEASFEFSRSHSCLFNGHAFPLKRALTAGADEGSFSFGVVDDPHQRSGAALVAPSRCARARISSRLLDHRDSLATEARRLNHSSLNRQTPPLLWSPIPMVCVGQDTHCEALAILFVPGYGGTSSQRRGGTCWPD